MMGAQIAPAQMFYDFCLDDHVPADHLLRRIDQFSISRVRDRRCGRSTATSVAPSLMVRILIVGYCMGIRSERRQAKQKRVQQLERVGARYIYISA
jgi:transposase